MKTLRRDPFYRCSGCDGLIKKDLNELFVPWDRRKGKADTNVRVCIDCLKVMDAMKIISCITLVKMYRKLKV